MKHTRFLKPLILVHSLVPLAVLAADGYWHNLGTNPLEFLARATGILTLLFLMLSLAVTPARKVLGQPWLEPLRRTLVLWGRPVFCSCSRWPSPPTTR